MWPLWGSHPSWAWTQIRSENTRDSLSSGSGGPRGDATGCKARQSWIPAHGLMEYPRLNEHRLMVVGGGNAGRALAAAAAVSGLAEVVAVCDTDESRLRPWVESYPDIQAGTDLAALLRI